jgi:NAD(P)-dependent dehydrogenase (short-subunit alcohol dehydrogenase family)
MNLGLSGRVAIVAAASKGLGRAVAEELAREGASVAICSRTAGDLERVAADIQKATGTATFYRAVDVSDASAVSRFVSAVADRFGRLDICITNSGGPPSKLFADTKPEDWRAAVDLLCQGNIAAHAGEQVGSLHHHHLLGREAADRRAIALEFHPRRGNRVGSHPCE